MGRSVHGQEHGKQCHRDRHQEVKEADSHQQHGPGLLASLESQSEVFVFDQQQQEEEEEEKVQQKDHEEASGYNGHCSHPHSQS